MRSTYSASAQRRRTKLSEELTEFLVQLDGAETNGPNHDPRTVRRRFVKRIYIPFGRTLVRLTDEYYSGADIRSLCTEAAMG